MTIAERITCRHFLRMRLDLVAEQLPQLRDPGSLLAMLAPGSVVTLVFDVDVDRTLWLTAAYPGRVSGKTLYEEDGAELWFAESHAAWIPERRQWLDVEALEGD